MEAAVLDKRRRGGSELLQAIVFQLFPFIKKLHDRQKIQIPATKKYR